MQAQTAVTMLALYVAATLSYSVFWKRVPVLDVFVLASLFTFRLGFGIVLTDVRPSPWLLVFSMFVFLSLSLAKRHTELLRLPEHGLAALPGRGYVAGDALLTLVMGMASMLGAVLIAILLSHRRCFPAPLLYQFGLSLGNSTAPLSVSRAGLVASQRGQLDDDPVVFAVTDRICLILGMLMGISFAAALFGLSLS